MRKPMQGAPEVLSQKHHHMAYLVAAGRTNADITKALGYGRSRVAIIKSSPAFQALVEKLGAEIGRRTTDTIVDRLMEEGADSVIRLRQLRDQDKNLSVAYNASTFFLEKHPEVAAIKATAEIGARILLDAAVFERMDRAIAEADGRTLPALERAPG